MMNEGKGEVIQNIERVVDRLPLMTYGLKVSLEAYSDASFRDYLA